MNKQTADYSQNVQTNTKLAHSRLTVFVFYLLFIIFGIREHSRDVEHYLMTFVHCVDSLQTSRVVWNKKWIIERRNSLSRTLNYFRQLYFSITASPLWGSTEYTVQAAHISARVKPKSMTTVSTKRGKHRHNLQDQGSWGGCYLLLTSKPPLNLSQFFNLILPPSSWTKFKNSSLPFSIRQFRKQQIDVKNK